jgi:hypothetical protein
VEDEASSEVEGEGGELQLLVVDLKFRFGDRPLARRVAGIQLRSLLVTVASYVRESVHLCQ